MEDLIYSDKVLMTILCIVINIMYIYILYTQELNTFDKIYILTNFLCHIVFYIFLWNYNSNVIFVLHILVMVYGMLSIFATNKYLIISCILVILFAFGMWIFAGRCPLKDKDSMFMGGRGPSLLTYIVSSLVLLRLTYKLFNCNPLNLT
jgi:hypothetical protein